MTLRRVLIVASVAVVGFAATMIATEAARGDIKRLANKYPAVASTELAKQIVGSIPLVGGIATFFAAPALDVASESGMTPEDKAALERDHAILTWAPMAGLGLLVVTIPLALWFLWTDVIQTPVGSVRLHELRLAGIQATGQAAGTAVPAVATGGASVPAQAASKAVSA